MARELIVEADGGSRGNPGVAGSGAIVIDASTGEILAEIGVYVGIASNNVAEYTGMISGIRRALEIEPNANLHVRMDSKLVVEQMSGRWKIKHPAMADLAAEARQLLTGTPVIFEWMPRAENSRADRIANEVMDKKQSFVRGVAAHETKASSHEKRTVAFE
jgi:ribonuclease HI